MRTIDIFINDGKMWHDMKHSRLKEQINTKQLGQFRLSNSF